MKRVHYLVLGLVLLLGLGLRLYAIDIVRNVDEPNIIKRAVKVADGQWHIYWYNWPAQSLIHIDGILFKFYALARGMANPFWRQSVEQLYQQHRTQFNTLAHGMSVGFALLTLVLQYFIGKKLLDRTTGLLATLFLAVSFLHVTNSRFATPDVPMTALFMVNILIALKLLKDNSKQAYWYAIAGAVVGLAVATKYTGVLTVLPILTVLVIKETFSWKSILFACMAGFVSHTLFNLYWFVDWKIIYHDIAFETKPERLGVDWAGASFPFLHNLWFYIRESLSWNGTLISLVAYATIIGITAQLIRHKLSNWRYHMVIEVFFIMALLGLSALGLHWSRWAVPFSPLLALYAALGCTVARRYLKLVGTIILVIVMVIPQIALSWASGYVFIHEQGTAQVMSQYILANVPTGSKMVTDTYYLDLHKRYHLVVSRDDLYRTALVDYRARGIQYLLVKPKRLKVALKEPEKYSSLINFFTDLQTTATKVVTIAPQQYSMLELRYDHQVYYWLWQLLIHGQQPTGVPTKGAVLELYKL